MRSQIDVAVDAANELGEGVVWSPEHSEAQWTDIFGRRFWAYRPADGESRSWALPDRLACFAPLGGRSLLAGFAGGLLVGIFADSHMAVYINPDGTPWFSATGGWHLFKWQLFAGLWVICFTAVSTFLILKLVGLVIPLRMSERDMEEGDIAVHGHEVYPSDIPSLGYPGGVGGGILGSAGGHATAHEPTVG